MNTSQPSRDMLTILSGTSQNVVGIGVAAAATFAAQVLLSRTLGSAGFGAVTVLTQAAFVASFATRAGMDMAVLRNVAIDAGAGRWSHIRTMVSRAALVAGITSAVVALVGLMFADPIRRLFSIDESLGQYAVQAALLGLPFLALANVWLGATRGLKIMRYTLFVFWAGQPIMWIILMLGGWTFEQTVWMAVLAYTISWAWAAAAAWWCWHRESASWETAPLEPGDMGRLVRYAAPRAPAALFSQLLFWTDLFVVANFVSSEQVGVYSAALRAGQIMLLFLTSVNLMFSPFVADLHSRGEIAQLDRLFKTLKRWTLAATLPIFLVILVTPGSVLDVFGPDFSEGRTALVIILFGQLLSIATGGTAGFVLIMVGRTGWDLVVYACSLALDLALAFWLSPRYGITGAAIANATTFTASTILRLLLVIRFVGIQPYDRHYLRLFAPTALAMAAMLLLHIPVADAGWAVDLLVTGGIGTAVYLAAYLAFGLTPEERRGASGLIARVRGA